MQIFSSTHVRFGPGKLRLNWASLMCLTLLLLAGCHRNRPIAIAVIPRTTSTPLWEAEHLGAKAVASKLGVRIYWNAPTGEDDVAAQIALVNKVSAGNYQGLVLAPDDAQALITPVRAAILRGMPVVIVGSPLSIPSNNRLCYILNDEEAGGRIAAQRVAAMLHGRGKVALLGVDPAVIGIVTRARTLEQYFTKNFPEIHVVVRRMGSFNELHEQQMAEETLKENPDLDAIVALSSASAHGVLSAISERQASRVKVIAFDRDDAASLMFDVPNVDSVVMQDTQKMGAEAVHQILSSLQGRPMVSIMQFEPVLLTRETIDVQMRKLWSMMDTMPVQSRWKWMVGP
jgi:ribose transport system substrate-binding protein